MTKECGREHKSWMGIIVQHGPKGSLKEAEVPLEEQRSRTTLRSQKGALLARCGHLYSLVCLLCVCVCE